MAAAGRWQRVKDVFEAALDRPVAERARFLGEICGDDADVRREVESLLGAQQEAGGFLSRPAISFPEAFEADGRRIGPYRVLSRIGHGGMGVVYRAVRDDDVFRKTVALKVVHGGGSPELLRRLGRERQILARLQHPNIATILDGGTTDEGQPYLVMEHVEGRPIDAYCNARGLATRRRLEMFRMVCAAVHYAHQNLVVHRDLKPQNILVTADGQPKLLDFGIAKLLAAGVDPEDAPTATLLPLMTPEYASPEQVRGQPVTTASDVYSLGVLLYELLTGRRPFMVRSDSLEEIVRVVCDTEPEAPSAARRGARPATTGPWASPRELVGDLDTIVLKALRKEPGRRYGSAQELSEDIRRHLDGLPVAARADSVAYRAGKFVRRHRVGVVAAGLVAASLVGGIVMTARQARIAEANRARAERRFNDVRKLAKTFMFDVHDAVKDLPGSTPARKLLVSKALEYLDGLAQEAREDPMLQEELATAYERVGDVQGNPYGANLGDTPGALQSYGKGLAIREALAADHPSDTGARRNLARDHVLLALTLDNTTRSGEVREQLERGLRLYEQISAEAPADPEIRRDLARTHSRACALFPKLRLVPQAVAHCRAALAISEELAAKGPRSAVTLREFALQHEQLGRVLLAGDARNEEGLTHLRKAVEIDEERARIDPKAPGIQRDLSIEYSSLGRALMLIGDHGAGLAYLGKSLAAAEAVLAADPRNAQAQRDVAVSLSLLADAFRNAGRLRDALAYYGRTLAITQALVTASPSNAQARKDTAETLADIASVHARLGRLDLALDLEGQSLAMRETLVAEAPPDDVRFRHGLAKGYREMGDLHQARANRAGELGRRSMQTWREARSWYERSLVLWEELERRGVTTAKAERDAVTQRLAGIDARLAESGSGRLE